MTFENIRMIETIIITQSIFVWSVGYKKKKAIERQEIANPNRKTNKVKGSKAEMINVLIALLIVVCNIVSLFGLDVMIFFG